MIPMFMIALLGLGAAAFMFGDIFDDDDRSAAGGEVPPDDNGEDDGDGVDVDMMTTLLGTIEADTLTDDDLLETTEIVDALEGDDVIMFSAGGLDIHGGPGSDDISVNGEGQTLTDLLLSGDLGDDTLSATDVANSTLEGGDGDDELSLTQTAVAGADPNMLSGGDGDDMMTIEADFTADTGPDIQAEGGEGADVFTLSMAPDFTDGPNTEDTASPVLNITDFSPAEDQLVVDLSDTELPDDVDSVETRLEQNGANLEMVVTFLTDGGEELNGLINLGPATITPGMTAEDFVTIIFPDGFTATPLMS